MNLILDNLFNLLWLIIGTIIGFYLNKDKAKETIKGVRSILIKPSGTIIDSKEENSLNRMGDEVNYHHNSYFDEEL